MSAAKRHISSLLAPSSNGHDGLDGTSTDQSAKRPRIEELLSDNAPGIIVHGNGLGRESLRAEDDADYQSSVLSTSSSEPSSLSSSSDDDDDDDDDEEEEEEEEEEKSKHPPASNHQTSEAERSSSLRARLKHFLPQLHKANETLDRSAASTFEILKDQDQGVDPTVGGAEEGQSLRGTNEYSQDPYIEMNLGLGVLEERHADDTSSSSSGEDLGSGNGDETHILNRLMGRKDDTKDAGIQEL